ncbi:hypothetical protein [Streptomyces sp. NPDC004291]
MSASPASAHVVYTSDEMWSNTDSSKCLYSRSEVSHGAGMGYFKGRSMASKDAELWPADCTLPWYRPQGHLATRLYIFKWNASQGKWLVCRSTSWLYNGGNNASFTVQATTNTHTTPPCGKGYYGTSTISSVSYGGTWYGNIGLWSGHHYLPTTASLMSSQADITPDWVDEKGRVDAERAPSRMGVAGSDGSPLLNGEGEPVTVPAELAGVEPDGDPLRYQEDGLHHETVTDENGETNEIAYVPLLELDAG